MFGLEGPMYQHSVGFSGVLFQLSVLEANLNPHSERSVFGMFRVSSSSYPWAMLLVMQFILPHVSFLGHLSGILVGTLQLFGVFDFMFPSNACLRAIEDWTYIRPLTSKPNFVRVPVEDEAQGRTPFMLIIAMNRLAYSCFIQCGYLLETLKFCIFGANVTQRALEVERLPQSDDDPDTLALTDTQNISDINDIELQMAIAESLSKK
jgi:rhomboid domain-containing protein 1